MTRRSPYAWPPQPCRDPQHAAALGGNAMLGGRARRAMKLSLIASAWVAGIFVVIAAVTRVAMTTSPIAKTSGAAAARGGPDGGRTAGGVTAAGRDASIASSRPADDRQAGHGAAGGTSVPHAASSATATSAPARIATVYIGTGRARTSPFSIGGDGSWKLAWSYSCAGLDPDSAFSIGQDGQGSLDGTSVARSGNAGRGARRIRHDAGTHYLLITSLCRWRITVTSNL
jgi:hypothetical protein